jgi:uncharacterized protein (TIGR02147 family)
MKKVSVFEFNSYKAFMKARLRGREQRGALSRAAEVLNCQRSFLSRVMNTKMNLTPDHCFLLSGHFQLNKEEREYFQSLLELERCSDRSFREHLNKKSEDLKRKHEMVSEIIKRPKPQGFEVTYVSSWHWAAIHLLTSIPRLQKSQALADRLNIPLQLVEKSLNQLQEWGCVQFKDGCWKYLSGEFHLSNENPLVGMLHQNWRSRATLSAQNPENKNLHYTNVQTGSAEDVEKVKALGRQYIADCNRILGPSKPEQGVAMTFDVFII